MSTLKRAEQVKKFNRVVGECVPAYTLIFQDKMTAASQFKRLKEQLSAVKSVLCTFISRRNTMIKTLEVRPQYSSKYLEDLRRESKSKILIVFCSSLQDLSRILGVVEHLSMSDYYKINSTAEQTLVLGSGLTGIRPNQHTKALEKLGDVSLEKGIVKIRSPITLVRAGHTIDRTVDGILRCLELRAYTRKFELKSILSTGGELLSSSMIRSCSTPDLLRSFRVLLRTTVDLQSTTPVPSKLNIIRGLRVFCSNLNAISTHINVCIANRGILK
jgi:hypothetical protein